MSVEIKICSSDEEIMSTWPVMSQLRPHIAENEYLTTIQRLSNNNYRLVGAFHDGICVGAMGYTPGEKLSAGPCVYVNDLITDPAQRSQSIGKQLIDWVKNEARNLNCKSVILDSGLQRGRAHKFYFREGFVVRALNFICEL